MSMQKILGICCISTKNKWQNLKKASADHFSLLIKNQKRKL